jgi:MOSC domain-containing protein YiiM
VNCSPCSRGTKIKGDRLEGCIVQVNVSNGGIPEMPVPRARMGVHGGARHAVLLISIEDFDEIRAGDALLKLTKPRKPCRTPEPFGPGFPKAVMERGDYAAVVEPGLVKPGDAIRLEF